MFKTSNDDGVQVENHQKSSDRAVWRAITGRRGEELAREAYLRAGARLVCANYRRKCGEIDLIFEETGKGGTTLVFVEVRARSPDSSWESPEESLTPTKLRRIRNAASAFLQAYRGCASSIRFDLASWDLSRLRIHQNFWWY